MRPANVYHLGIKELRSLAADPILVFFVVVAFSFTVYANSTISFELRNAQIAIVDQDHSPLTRTHLADAAARVANAAALELDERRRQVAVEVKTTLVQTNAARAAVAVAKQTIGSAEEAYHAMQARVTAGTATTTDLLDAQTALTRARLNLARARYSEAIRHVAYLRAIGE